MSALKSKKKKYLVFMFLSWIVLLLSISDIICYFIDQNRVNKTIEQLQSTFKEEKYTKMGLINPPEDENDSYWNYANEPFLQVDFSELIKSNPDTVAWVQLNGTPIDYAVVQTVNNDYYLTHSFDKSYSKAGWIFSDFRNNFQALNKNTIIYGHRRLDDSMFGSLKYTLEENWYNNPNNRIIKISTPQENSIWQIFSVYSIYQETYYITTFFENDPAFQEFLNTIVNRSIFSFDTSVNVNDKILTLSSCLDNSGNRVVVHAKLIKKEVTS